MREKRNGDDVEHAGGPFFFLTDFPIFIANIGRISSLLCPSPLFSTCRI